MAQQQASKTPTHLAVVTLRPWILTEQVQENGVATGTQSRTVAFGEQIKVGYQLGLELVSSGKALTPEQIAREYEMRGEKAPKELVAQLNGLGYTNPVERLKRVNEAPSAALVAQAAMIGEIVSNAVTQALAAAGISPKSAS